MAAQKKSQQDKLPLIISRQQAIVKTHINKKQIFIAELHMNSINLLCIKYILNM